jgi:hypothetical protein
MRSPKVTIPVAMVTGTTTGKLTGGSTPAVLVVGVGAVVPAVDAEEVADGGEAVIVLPVAQLPVKTIMSAQARTAKMERFFILNGSSIFNKS